MICWYWRNNLNACSLYFMYISINNKKLDECVSVACCSQNNFSISKIFRTLFVHTVKVNNNIKVSNKSKNKMKANRTNGRKTQYSRGFFLAEGYKTRKHNTHPQLISDLMIKSNHCLFTTGMKTHDKNITPKKQNKFKNKTKNEQNPTDPTYILIRYDTNEKSKICYYLVGVVIITFIANTLKRWRPGQNCWENCWSLKSKFNANKISCVYGLHHNHRHSPCSPSSSTAKSYPKCIHYILLCYRWLCVVASLLVSFFGLCWMWQGNG